jgi:adenine phosphoribosyltransferase
VSYALEYGSGALEAHHDPSIACERVAIIDDVLATGGTATATAQLIEMLGATCAGYGFLIEIAALGGRARLGAQPAVVLLRY